MTGTVIDGNVYSFNLHWTLNFPFMAMISLFTNNLYVCGDYVCEFYVGIQTGDLWQKGQYVSG